MKYELILRASTTSSVIPPSVNRKCLGGSSNGESMIGFSMTTCFKLHGPRMPVCLVYSAQGGECGTRKEPRYEAVHPVTLCLPFCVPGTEVPVWWAANQRAGKAVPL